jgi:HK97 family phage prohead protease
MNIRVNKDYVEIEGYVNAVERLSKTLRDRLGEFVERVKAGAFKKALSRAEDVRILLNHDPARDLGGTADGNLELYEDAIGLHARATITDKEVIEQAKRGDLVGWSFGFTDRDVEQTEENGQIVQTEKDLNLFEVSLINRDKVPAYDGTLVAVRSGEETLNISDITEANIRVTEEEIEEEVEERAEETKDDNHADEENGAIDYTEYHNIIKEMKGD